jgi:phosphoribosylaminoimidazole-succinocarboxamide synthase
MSGSAAEFKSIEYRDHFITPKNSKVSAKGFGEKTASLNAFFLDYLKGYNIPVAYQKRSDKNHLHFVNFAEIPLKVKILNNADARTSKIFPIKYLSQLELPIIEFHFGDSKDTLISESHIVSFNLSSYDDIKFISRLCSKINAIIKSFFDRRNVTLVELTSIFGKFDGKIFLVGDFSPASIKIIDNNKNGNLPDLYKIETPAQMKKYADFLVKLTSGE